MVPFTNFIHPRFTLMRNKGVLHMLTVPRNDRHALAFPTIMAVLLLGTLSQSAMAFQTQKSDAGAKAKRAVHPAMVPVEEKVGLPRVLLIGDSISMGYTVPVRELLEDKANVLRPLTNCGPTSRGVASLDEWLGDGHWDVIHFNFGLHDMVFFSADGKTRAEPSVEGAKHQVPVEDYEKNLRQMVDRLKKTGAKLIWCTTTPVPEGSGGRLADESVLYNEVAAKVMKENDIAVDDLHAFALPQLEKIQLPKNVHFTPDGSKVLAEEVVRSITAALAEKK